MHYMFVLQIFAAMEYSITSVPSLIWESPGGGGSLYLGESYHGDASPLTSNKKYHHRGLQGGH